MNDDEGRRDEETMTKDEFFNYGTNRGYGRDDDDERKSDDEGTMTMNEKR